jgi:hypothetical protein
MMKSDSVTQRTATLGDAAVSGLLAGGGAGVVMMLYLAAVGLAQGDALGTTLGRFDAGVVGPGGSPLVGLLAHLATAAVYGALFGGAGRFVPKGWRGRVPSWLAGVGYGLILWGLALAALLPALATSLRAIPPLHFAIAHGLYGLVLGIGLAWRKAN